MVIYGYLWHQYDLELLGGTPSTFLVNSCLRNKNLAMKVFDLKSELF